MVKNQELINNILDTISVTIEACEYLYKVSKNLSYKDFYIVMSDIYRVIDTIYFQISKIDENKRLAMKLDLSCDNAYYSLKNIEKLYNSRSKIISDKIKFELINILEDMYLKCYFWGTIYPDKNKIENYYKYDLKNLCFNKNIEKYRLAKKYKYDLSIIVVGYNKLEYTKLCIENLLKHVPQNINYELILLNHGSTDDTKIYFENLAPTKQIDILKNGGSPTATIRAIEGRYCLTVSNDVIVTKNAIENMIKCMDSDESIAWVVPSTPNVSNLQTIASNYSNIDEMHKFSEENNISNHNRWEIRSRLCNPIDLKRSDVWYSKNGLCWGGYFNQTNQMSFPDDKVSMLLRRKGYKMVLAKDSYCYHFGSVTLKEENEKYTSDNGNGSVAFYEEGRNVFFDMYGIDPWGIGFCYDFTLFEYLNKILLKDEEEINILGVNTGLGSNTLKVRESIKENTGNLDVNIYNIVQDKKYVDELKSLSNEVVCVNNEEQVYDFLIDKEFKYIIIEDLDCELKVIEELYKKLIKDGVICINIRNIKIEKLINNMNYSVNRVGEWIIINK